METVTTEWVDKGEKRDRRGRRIALARHRAAVVEEYERSGLTQRVFAEEREGIKCFTFTHWIRTERARKPRPPTFAEIKVGPARGPVREPSAMEVALPNGLWCVALTWSNWQSWWTDCANADV